MAESLHIAPGVEIDPDELEWRFTPSGGPGGQHANRNATRAEVRFDIATSPSLTDVHRTLLVERLGAEARVSVDETRSQLRNRELAVERLTAQLATALHRPKNRRKTKPSRGSVERRIAEKKRRSETKRGRQSRDTDG